ncbi:uncharacterized protein STEHIDRAFT_109611 [Stereum hirsutum FP-91666 SS1]|uniref:uncharacterized protein n=1 Tax=Stereum hirsutum (strain FP-91666) TaxID=721885 RepID=UPI000440FF79|nr:uncharacterized protein STEHIDRAFT_109611 [Stereum hirsutum FP-91666 SS1]EIM89429.1 hypothetical protein STEHIDRAFT_109611 [Stereum hirsutum FP-91666 SS1]
MQFSTPFFVFVSALLFLVPAASAIACDPLSACNGQNHYNAGHSCKFYTAYPPVVACRDVTKSLVLTLGFHALLAPIKWSSFENVPMYDCSIRGQSVTLISRMMSSDQQSESHHGVKVPKSEDPVAILPESEESVIVAFPEACLTHAFDTTDILGGRALLVSLYQPYSFNVSRGQKNGTLHIPLAVRTATLASIVMVHGPILAKHVYSYSLNHPYSCGIPLLRLGIEPLYVCSSTILLPVWRGFLLAIRLRNPTSSATSGSRNQIRTVEEAIGTLMGAAMGAWGGYVLGRQWLLW